MFGAVNSLFSGLAFATLIFTISLQKKELALQRDELSLTRDELRGQKEVMKSQAQNLKVQSFEGTFFQMLRLHNDILSSFDIDINKQDHIAETGRDCFSYIIRRYLKSLKLSEFETKEGKIKRIRAVYKNIWKKHKGELGVYFRSLYTIVKFIDESDIEDKKRYTNIVRSQLSEQELTVILLNCIWLEDSKFTPLAIQYDLLKHVPSGMNLLLYSNQATAEPADGING